MGGYAAYIIPAFLAAAIIMAWMAVSSLHGLARARKRLAALQSVLHDEA